MGIDIRMGRRDNYARYYVFGANTDIRRSDINYSKECIGVLHAQDITAYETTSNVYGNKFQRDSSRATIKTYDMIEIAPDYLLYSLAEGLWYRVVSTAPNSINDTQRYSARPSNETLIVIQRQL